MTARVRSQAAKGFTLIELLVVVAIIGLLASIILASLNTARAKGRDARRLADIREIQNALELYQQTCKNYPTASSALSAANPPVVTSSALQLGDNNGCPSGVTLGTFLTTIPADPGSGYPYLYVAFGSTTVCTSYHLGAELELAVTTGAGQAASNASKCTNGTYQGHQGYGPNNEISATNGDFGGGGTAGSWVYDAVP